MALTVALVRILNPEGESNSGAVFLASAYYSEQVGGEGAGIEGLQWLHSRTPLLKRRCACVFARACRRATPPARSWAARCSTPSSSSVWWR